MEVVETAIPDVKIITRKKFGDHLPQAGSDCPRLSQAALGRPVLPVTSPPLHKYDDV